MSERHVFKRDWIACLKYANHSRLNRQHDWGDLYDFINEQEHFTHLLGYVLWDQVPNEHNSLSILGFPVYGEHSNCVLWTFRQVDVDYHYS